MQKILLTILFIYAFVALAAGQVTTLKNDIPEDQYQTAEIKGMRLLRLRNYRSLWTKVYFADRWKDGELQEKKSYQIIQPDKWSEVVEVFGANPSRRETIADGKDFYFRTNDGPWEKGSLGTGSGGSIESGEVKYQYRFLPSIDLYGETTNFYELVSTRTANKYSQNGYAVVKYIRTIRTWYSVDGKLLRKIEETMIEGQQEMLRETTIYKYNPPGLQIVAPPIK